MEMVLTLALLLILLGVGLWLWGRRQRLATGVPVGEVIYSDTGEWETVQKPLLSRRYGLVGRPDYLVRVRKAGVEQVIPVEVKSHARPKQPYEGHILQLATYCLLIEDTMGVRPPHGLLRYANATLCIPYTDDLRQRVLATADAIRAARTASTVHRQHAEPQRCRPCGYRGACGKEALE